MDSRKVLTVLLIEDNEIEALLIKEQLNDSNYVLYNAKSFLEGKHLLSQNIVFDAVLLDLTLPDSEGVNTFHKFQFYAPHLPIIILTGIEDEEVVIDTLQNGAQDFLVKRHVTANALKRSIRYAIERKQTELRLKEALDLNQKIFSATSLGIVTFKASGECVFANEAASKIVNLPVEMLLKQNFHTISSWKKSELYSIACDVLQTNVPRYQEINILSTAGRELWIDFYFATFTKSGEPHLLLIMIDNTNRKIIAKDLEWKNYLMDIFMQHIPNAVYFKDKDGRFTEVSKAMATKFGFNDSRELTGKTDFDLFSSEHAEKAAKDEQQIIKSGIGLYNNEERETYDNKPDSWVISSKMPLLNANGEIIGTFGISGDVTGRKKAEQELIKSKSQLSEAMELAQLYFWEYDLENQKIIFDDRLCKLLGINIPGQSSCSLTYNEYLGKYVHPNDRYIVDEENLKLKLAVKKSGYFTQFEYRLITSEGNIRHIIVRLRVESEPEDNLYRYHGIMQDITDRKIALQESWEALNKVDALKTEFLTYISHELRTPLNGIVGAINLLKNQENSSAIKHLVEILDKSVSNLEVFTENASYYSKLSNKYKPDFSEFNLKESIQFALLENENGLTDKNLKIHFDFPEEIPVISADSDLIYKAVFNIIQIFLFFSQTNHTIMIRVKNEPDQLTCVFENKEVIFPAYMLKKDIGLSDIYINQQIGLCCGIVRQILDLHQSSLIVNSDLKGSAILFSLKK